MAVVELIGGGGSVRVSSGKRARGGEREQRERKRSEGTRGVVVASLGRPGEAGGGVRWPCARRHALILLAEEEGDREGGGGGLGRLLQQAAQVSGPQVSVR